MRIGVIKYISLLLCFWVIAGCATPKSTKQMTVTGYCGCGECCGWKRGNIKYLKLDVWNKYVKNSKGKKYTGRTSSGIKPHEPVPGLFSVNSITHPWMIPIRVVFFPWLLLPKDGTIAADTRYYKFGTRMYVPGYGWGVVEDRGGAIKGSKRLDLYFRSHGKALKWGKKKVDVIIVKK